MHRRMVLLGTLVVAVAFVAGIVVARHFFPASHAPEIAGVGPASKIDHAHAETTYVCPMHAQVISDKPGACPVCGMALVPAQPAGTEAEADTDAMPAVRIAPEVIHNLGVKIARVKRTTLVRRIETPGFVQQIEPAQNARVVAPFDGRVTAVHIKSGQRVERGKPLATLESEALRAAEQTHIALLERVALKPDDKTSDAAPEQYHGASLDKSREQLGLLGLSDDAIQQLEHKREVSSKLTLYAPFAAQVANLQVAVGDSVTAGASLFMLSGQVRAEVLANAFQRDAAWIQTGQPVEVRLPHVSSQTWPGVVNQGAVSFDPNSQNIGIRLSFTAPMHLLKSGMYVVATVHGDSRPGVLAIPQEALIRAESEDRVIVALGDGRFKPVAVRTGIESGGQIEILGGLKEGDQIVVSAQFLLDSESSLQASFRRMTAH